MRKFIDKYIDTDELPQATGDEKVGRNVRIAVIDSGFHNGGDPFLDNPDVSQRIKEGRNFFSPGDSDPNPSDWKDCHGHGTHVTRLLLKLAPRAEIFVAKMTNSKTLKLTKKHQFSKVNPRIP
jgi:hypothetical protein